MGRDPVILLDCDDVLADFATPALKLVAELGGPTTRTGWDIGDMLEGVARDRFWETVSAPGWCAGLQPYPWALENVRALQKLGEVVVVTTPLRRCPTWMFERTQWCKKHFGFEHSHVANIENKALVHGDFLADDGVHNLEAWQHGHKFLIAHSYNASEGRFKRGTLEDFVSFVREMWRS